MLQRFFPLRRALAALAAALVLATLTACRQKPGANDNDDSKPVLTASIAPAAYVVAAVAGEGYAVEAMMPAGASPESYEPSARQIMNLNRSKALFRIGTLGFERTHLDKLAAQAPHLKPVNLAAGIAPLPLPARAHRHEGGNGGAHAGESDDPHAWMSPAALKLMAANAARALCALDSAGCAGYTERLRRFETRMDSIDNAVRTKLKGVEHRTFLIFHPALGYFARDFGLRQLAVEADGKTPSAEAMQQLISGAKAEGVRVVFISEEHEGKAARRVAEAIGAQIVKINPPGGDPAAEMLKIAEALRLAEEKGGTK